jgi:hypothetical protein
LLDTPPRAPSHRKKLRHADSVRAIDVGASPPECSLAA